MSERHHLLCRPFAFYDDHHKPWQDKTSTVLSETLHEQESQVELWYPLGKRLFEVIVSVSSLHPLLLYYLSKLEEWRLVFQQCKVCGKYFAAKSRHFELCSDDCRRVQSVGAKREFDERTRGSLLEQLDETAYNYWYTRLRKLKKGKKADAEKAAAFKTAFDEYRQEAVKRKGAVKRGEMALADFSGWLAMQNDKADRPMAMGTAELAELAEQMKRQA